MKYIRHIIFFTFGMLLLLPTFVLSERVTIGNAEGFLQEAVRPTGISQTDLSTSAGTLVKRLLAATGIIFFGLMVYAGFLWMTARGEEDQIAKARNTIFGAIIGLVITIGAYGLTSLIVTKLQESAAGRGAGSESGPRIGCCQDKVNALWACRVTTEQDCQTQGLQCGPGDDFCAPNDFTFNAQIQEIPACVATCDAKND
ncbi:MAG: hypothetical protein KBD15_04000 [Candidatus Magasanikbacteria bacterium]|jgi:hypothetical protein|nr:hypothetical protein [Candidatus Magasanikbacteria bacterium]